MTEYDNTNRGEIWKNDRKDSDRHPDFKGSINVEGRDYWLSGWLRAADANPRAPSMRFSVTPKDEAQAEGINNAKAAIKPEIPPFDDQQIPF